MLTFSAVFAAPLSSRAVPGHENHEEPNTTDPSIWVLFAASAVLVLTGGAFAGLTIAYVEPVDSSQNGPILSQPAANMRFHNKG